MNTTITTDKHGEVVRTWNLDAIAFIRDGVWKGNHASRYEVFLIGAGCERIDEAEYKHLQKLMLREQKQECDKQPTEGWQVCVENARVGEEPEFYVNDVHLDHDAAVEEWKNAIHELKTDTGGNIDWLAHALQDFPRDITEKSEGEFLLTFTDNATGDQLSVYINEVEIK